MKIIKDIIISTFAVIGLVAILSSFTSNKEESVQNGEWQLSCVPNENWNIICKKINTRTGYVENVK